MNLPDNFVFEDVLNTNQIPCPICDRFGSWRKYSVPINFGPFAICEDCRFCFNIKNVLAHIVNIDLIDPSMSIATYIYDIDRREIRHYYFTLNEEKKWILIQEDIKNPDCN